LWINREEATMAASAQAPHDYLSCGNAKCGSHLCIACQAGYDLGYEDGYRKGVLDGYKAGYEKGFAAGAREAAR
jgi:flagellar biosynthesis/type III secretory pathway protein FliH